MSFDGNGYAEYASTVITSKGDIIRGNASGKRERYGIGSSNQILQVSSVNQLGKHFQQRDQY